jgi:hypothetical protein
VNPDAPNETPAAVADATADAGAATDAATEAAAEPNLIGDAATGGADDAADGAGDAADADGDGAAADAGEGEVAEADADAPPPPYEGLTAPEGTTLDPADIELATPLMRQFGVPDDQAQAFLDGAAPIIGQIVNRALDGVTASMAENRAEVTRGWVEEIKADPVIGGANYAKSMADVARFRDQFCDAKTVADLAESGYANNPGLVRAFAAAGAALAEGSIHRGEGGQQERTTAQKLYDSAFQPKAE